MALEHKPDHVPAPERSLEYESFEVRTLTPHIGAEIRGLDLSKPLSDVQAKELRRVVEPLITMAKEDGVARRRLAFSRLRDRATVSKLFNELGPRYKDRPGGYLRILKMGYRNGDQAPIAYVELVDRPEPVAEEAAVAE